MPCGNPCEAKLILNGDVAARVLNATCEAIERHLANGGTFPNGEQLIVRLNRIEDDVFKFQRAVLEEIGFEGPWPKALQ